MKHYLPILALATPLLTLPPQAVAHSGELHDNLPSQTKVQAAASSTTLSAQVTASPRFIEADQELSNSLPLLGVAPVPQKGWLYGGSGLSVDALYQPKQPPQNASENTPFSTPLYWVDYARLHFGVGYSDTEKNWATDHAFLELAKNNTNLKVGRIAPFAQPAPMGSSSLLLAGLVGDDHLHADGLQIKQKIGSNWSVLLAGYREGSYLGDVAGKTPDGQNNGFELAGVKLSTAHAQLGWQNTNQSPTLGVTANLQHTPDNVRALTLATETATHTHGSAVEQCARASSNCFDGDSNLFWLSGFWRSTGSNASYHGLTTSSQASKAPTYGVDAIVAMQRLSGEINTPVTTLSATNQTYHVLTDLFYRPNKTKYLLRLEAMQIEHDISGPLANQSVKNLGLDKNDSNPWRIGAQVTHPIYKNINAVTSATYDKSRDDGEMIYSIGLDMSWRGSHKLR